MSHGQNVYILPERGLTTSASSNFSVREEGAEYNVTPFPESFVVYSDLIDNKLPKARVFARLLHEGALTDEQAIREAALAIVDYLDEIQLAPQGAVRQVRPIPRRGALRPRPHPGGLGRRRTFPVRRRPHESGKTMLAKRKLSAKLS